MIAEKAINERDYVNPIAPIVSQIMLFVYVSPEYTVGVIGLNDLLTL